MEDDTQDDDSIIESEYNISRFSYEKGDEVSSSHWLNKAEHDKRVQSNQKKNHQTVV